MVREKEGSSKEKQERYRKVGARMWGDEKFRSLSPMPPSGQGLWIYLLTGPFLGQVPGLFKAGRAAMAEDLEWSQEGFDECFQELFQKGLAKADFKAKLVWLPKAIQHNKPANPNVVKGWKDELGILPECALKTEALVEIGRALESMSAELANVFKQISGINGLEKPTQKRLGNGSPNGSANRSAPPSGNHYGKQEQYQEQYQEQDFSSYPGSGDTQDKVVQEDTSPTTGEVLSISARALAARGGR